MKRRLAGLALAAWILPPLAVPAFGTEPSKPFYDIAMTLRDGDRLVGTPRIRVAAGEPARMEVRRPGGGGYSITVTASALPDSLVQFASTIDVLSQAGVRRTARPALRVKLGEPAAIAFGEDGGGAKPFRIDLTVSRSAEPAKL